MVSADAVHDVLATISQAFRQASETLQRQFGVEAHAILEAAVLEAESQINEFCSNAPGDDGGGVDDAP